MLKARVSMAMLLAAAITVGSAGFALAQESETDPHHPENTPQAASPAGMNGMSGQGQGQGAMSGADMMSGGMMGRGMMKQPGMMGDMPMMGIKGPMMKILFAIADTNGDGALSFEEVTAIHKRIFDAIDANKDGKITPEEIQAFWRQ